MLIVELAKETQGRMTHDDLIGIDSDAKSDHQLVRHSLPAKFGHIRNKYSRYTKVTSTVNQLRERSLREGHHTIATAKQHAVDGQHQTKVGWLHHV